MLTLLESKSSSISLILQWNCKMRDAEQEGCGYNQTMQTETLQHLLDINKQFYQTFGNAFAHTRRRIQPGIRRLLTETIPPHGDWLDLGCGSGALGLEWIAQKHQGCYTGLDFSPVLLAEARKAVAPHLPAPGLDVQYLQADLGDPNWTEVLLQAHYDGLLAFAALHHIPGSEARLALLKQIRSLLPTGGLFIHSEWQFMNSPRWQKRILPWSKVDIADTDLDPGDTLLDWRHILPGQVEQIGLRYVHHFNRPELADLAANSGFNIHAEFESDGKEGNLGLYQVWQAV
jgi:tRNA (uracil-5-)-methyltransferase TRM9